MADRNELIKAAEMIKEHCKVAKCSDCLFKDGTRCCLGRGYAPERWQFPKPRRFTDEEIAFAKALKGIGVTVVNQDSAGGLYCDGITDQRGGKFYLPEGVFRAVANELLVASIDEIIAEGEE